MKITKNVLNYIDLYFCIDVNLKKNLKKKVNYDYNFMFQLLKIKKKKK